MSHADDPVVLRRLARLREELADENVPLTLDGPSGSRILAELTYARRPPRHERRTPAYGSLIFDGVPDWDSAPHPPLLVGDPSVSTPVLRRCADGGSSFTVVTPEGISGLAVFERSFDDELAAVRLQRCGAVVIQRGQTGLLRVCTANGVVSWDGSTWLHKPLADEYVALITTLAPHADPAVAAGLLELAVHALAAGCVGSTLVWNLDGHALDDRREGLLELSQAVQPPGLSVARRAHFPALVSIHSQVDLATIIGADGTVGPIGVRLNSTRRAISLVQATLGARHTSARRFTFDVPGVLALVVSESGRVTVFSGGGVAAHISPGRRDDQSSRAPAGDPHTLIVDCRSCEKQIALELGDPGRSRNMEPVACPACGHELNQPAGGRVIGIPVSSGP